jgi:hypothetical protein
MNFFCTLFDSDFLSRGLTMYKSLKEHCVNFHLYIFAFDDKCLEVLEKMSLPRTTVISLKEFEDEKLLEIKAGRSKVEYCWTCTPSIILYSLTKYKLKSCTYLDADLFFFDSPEILLNEIPDKDSVMITEHRFAEDDALTGILNGIYCVQFMVFKNNEDGLKVLKWWRNACIEWCYARSEPAKYGDQKYLDYWTFMFKGIHVLKNLGGEVGPWNVNQYCFHRKNNAVWGSEIVTGKEFKLIFYHFSFLRFFKDNTVQFKHYSLIADVIEMIYKPYISVLERTKSEINQIDDSFDPHGALDTELK